MSTSQAIDYKAVRDYACNCIVTTAEFPERVVATWDEYETLYKNTMLRADILVRQAEHATRLKYSLPDDWFPCELEVRLIDVFRKPVELLSNKLINDDVITAIEIARGRAGLSQPQGAIWSTWHGEAYRKLWETVSAAVTWGIDCNKNVLVEHEELRWQLLNPEEHLPDAAARLSTWNQMVNQYRGFQAGSKTVARFVNEVRMEFSSVVVPWVIDVDSREVSKDPPTDCDQEESPSKSQVKKCGGRKRLPSNGKLLELYDGQSSELSYDEKLGKTIERYHREFKGKAVPIAKHVGRETHYQPKSKRQLAKLIDDRTRSQKRAK